LFLASLKQCTDLSKVLAVNSYVFALGLLLFSQTSIFALALLFITVGAFGMMSVRTISNTVIQINVPNHFRGRVISIYLMVLTAMMPIGSLLIGTVSHYIGAQTTVLIEGFFALIIAVIYSRYLKNAKLKKDEESLLINQQEE